MPDHSSIEPSTVIEAARVAQAALRPGIDRDWGTTATGLEWDCRATLDHMVNAPLFHGTNLTMRSTKRLAGIRAGNPSAAIPELIDQLEYAATILAQIATLAPAEARGFHPAGMADAQGFIALSCNEMLLHAHDIASALGLPFEPPAELSSLVLGRLFPWAPAGAAPWPTLLYVSARGLLPGREPVPPDWMSHPAPLAEWDGKTIPRRG